MYISEVTVTDFMPYRGTYTLKFRRGRIVSIVGEYDGDPGRSNRSGKSSFVDAIIWCLTGESRAKKDVELVFNGAAETSVAVTIKDREKNEKTTITRVRTSDNRGRIEIAGLEGVKKAVAQAEIDRLIGMTYDDLVVTALFKQNDIDQFMQADSSEKKSILMKWLKVGAWSDHYAAADEYRAALGARRTQLSGKVEALEAIDGDPVALKAELDETIKAGVAGKREYEKLSAEVAQLEKRKAEMAVLLETRDEVETLDVEIEKLRRRRPDEYAHKVAITETRERLAKYATVTPEYLAKATEVRDRATKAIGTCQAEEAEIDRRLKASKSLTGVCPILNAECSRIEKDPNYEKNLRKEKAEVEARRARADEAIAKANKAIENGEKKAAIERKLATLEADEKLAQGIEEQIASLVARRSRLAKALPKDAADRFRVLHDQIEEGKVALRKRRNDNAELKRVEGVLVERIQGINDAIDRRRDAKAELADVERELADASYVTFMFGKNGIPSLELENSFKEVEDDANLILKRLGAPFVLEFESTRELGEWEANCLVCGTIFERGERTHVCKECETPRQKRRRDELQLKVFEGDAERPFYMDSGGGKVLLSVAIRLALVQLARRRHGSSWGTLFLDEVFGQLDVTNRKAMAELITTTIVKDLGFEQVFVISHDPTVQSSISDQVTVSRHAAEGWSELRA